MTDNIFRFPGTKTDEHAEPAVTADGILEKSLGRYDEVIIIGKTKGMGRYECVSTMEFTEVLYHLVRIEHRINTYLDEQ